MSPRTRNRIIILALSIIVMVLLFIMNVTRASEQNLPSTPTESTGVSNNEPTAAITRQISLTPTLSATPAVAAATNESVTDPESETQTAEARIITTAEAAMQKATQRARSMSNIVRGLFEDGVVSELGGTYKQMPDFSTSFNRSGYYQMHSSEQQAKYFVLRMNLLWDNAGEEVSYPTAGCGLVFGYQDIQNHERVFLNLDGNVRLHSMQEGEFSLASIDYFGTLEQQTGHANMILAVDQGWITVYVNNQQITHFQDEDIQSGLLAYAIAAGSSIDYGTICEFKDIELWIIE